jgi:hypothetical protein
MSTAVVFTRKQARLVRALRRDLQAALAAEEQAPTVERAWRLAARSERCLRLLRLAEAGLPLPAPRVPRARLGFAALAMVGRVVAGALARKASLALANAARVAKQARRVALRGARRTLRAVARRVLAVAVTLPRCPRVLALALAGWRVAAPVAVAPTVPAHATGPPSDPLATLLASHHHHHDHHHA